MTDLERLNILIQLLVAVASAYKYDGEEIDEMLAQSEAAILHDEILGKAVDHEETIRVLSTRSSMQLSAIFNRYKDIYGRSITKVYKQKIDIKLCYN